MLPLSLLLMMGLDHLPLPAEGGPRIPVAIQVAEGADVDDERMADLRRAVCDRSYHVRLVDDAAQSAVLFEIAGYEIDGDRHHVTGRYFSNGRWEPFGSWSSSGPPGPPPMLARFVESLTFGPAFERDQVQHMQRRDQGGGGCDSIKP
jgi:hypothetical protein